MQRRRGTAYSIMFITSLLSALRLTASGYIVSSNKSKSAQQAAIAKTCAIIASGIFIIKTKG